MYKPNDIVAVYGEVSHGGTLIYSRHDAPKDENDPILKRYTLMDVVEVKNQDAMIVKRRDGDFGTMFVHPKQCRLVSRDGIPVEPKKASLILIVEHEDLSGSEVSGSETRIIDAGGGPRSVRQAYDDIVNDFSDRSSEDLEDVLDKTTYKVFKGFEVTEEFKL